MQEEPSLPFWVFGYGSLMWNPEFAVAEQALATLPGFARRFCMSSIHHRGSEEDPGLVLALDPDPDAECRGVAFRVPDKLAAATLIAIRERELVSSAYVERRLDVHLDDGRRVEATAYVVDTGHVQYRADLDLETQAHIISSAVGGRGPNTEYLFNTVAHLAELGISDDDLFWLDARVRTITAEKR